MARSTTSDAVRVPHGYPTASIFIDESGSRASGNSFFVVAALKLREPGQLARDIRAIREQMSFDREFKFAEITRGSIPFYNELIDAVRDSDATFAATVVCGARYNPFAGRRDTWLVHAEITSQLLVGCINRRELVGVNLDVLTTPAGCSLEDTVRTMTNSRLRNQSVISAVALDSRCNDLLQVADLIAGSINHERRLTLAPAKTVSNKGRVALRLASSFGRPALADGRDSRVNIQTLRRGKVAAPTLKVVERSRRAAG
jgi:hypothetical protein